MATNDLRWQEPYAQFRWAVDAEVASLVEGTTNKRIARHLCCLDGWLNVWLYRMDGLLLVAFHDATTARWVLPTGDGWANVDTVLLAADAAQWIEQQP